MAAVVASDGTVRQLDGRAEPDFVVEPKDVQDAPRLAKLLGIMLRELARLKRSWAPRRIDFVDVTCAAGGVTIRLEHGFGGAVRWWVVDWQISAASGAPILQRYTGTDENTLVLWSDKAGVATIRVEEAGA